MDGKAAPIRLYAGGVHYFRPKDNRFYDRGFPLPEHGASDGDTETIRVFMDDLFLCPNCGAFHKEAYKTPDADWIDPRRRNIDVPAMWQAVEVRFKRPEFEPRPCADRKLCRRSLKSTRWRLHFEELDKRARRSSIEQAEIVAKLEAEKAARRALPQKVYVIGSGSCVKIGIARDVKRRLCMLQTSSPVPLAVVNYWECADAYDVERRLHKRYAKLKTSGEWFALPEVQLQKLITTERVS